MEQTMEPNILPEEASHFRRLCSDLDLINEELPVSPVNRKLTDKYFFIVFVSFMLLTISFTSYVLYYSDIRRVSGYDSCGNICGKKNSKYPEWECSGKDMTDKPITRNGTCVGYAEMVTPENLLARLDFRLQEMLEQEDYRRELTKRIDAATVNQSMVTNRMNKSREAGSNSNINTGTSLPNGNESYIYEKLNEILYTLLTAILCALALCLGTILLLRYATRCTIWFILGLAVVSLFYLSVSEWIEVYGKDSNRSVVSAIASSLGWFCLFCIVVFMRKKVPLVILIVKESTAALFDMPLMFGVSILASFMPAIIYSLTIVCIFFMWTAGKLAQLDDGTLTYTLGPWKFISVILTVLAVIWSLDFVHGIQYMIISGAIGKWYFTKDKKLIGNPIRTSAYVTFRYHLGTVALGSLVTISVYVVKIILHFLTKNDRIRKMTDCCMRPVMTLLTILSKTSYILVALHGLPFFKAGLKYSKLIKLNICNVIALIYTGSIVMKVVQILVTIFSVILIFFIVTIKNNDDSITVLIAIIVSYFITWAILGTIEMALATMFVCFCEDYMLNDGVKNPYAMSRSLMEFVDKIKRNEDENTEERLSEVS